MIPSSTVNNSKTRRAHRRRRLAGGLLLLGFSAAAWWWLAHWPPRAVGIAERPLPSEMALLTPQDRILILAPHPDDETLGCGGVIQQAVAMQLPVRVVFLTYGDNNEWSFLVYRKRPVILAKAVQRMGQLRRDEALAAARLLGLSPQQLIFLGYPDFGTLAIWNDHWGSRPPFRSLLTHASRVPYDNALRPGAPYKGEEVVRDLTTVLRDFRPTKIFLSHPADHNTDHRALYLFTRIALWDVAAEMQPEVYPYLIHFARWPRPKGYHPERATEPPRFLQSQILWQVLPLSPEQMERKRQALKAHRTQYAFSAKTLLSFIRRNELFGDFPVVTLRPAAAVSTGAQPIGGAVPTDTAPEPPSDVERGAFVGVEWRFVRLAGRTVVFTIELSRPLAEETQLSVYLFGYREDRPFAAMPKVHIRLGVIGHTVYDQRDKLSPASIEVARRARRIELRVPLRILGDPQRMLTSARTYLGEVPLDWAAWRMLELPVVPPPRAVLQ